MKTIFTLFAVLVVVACNNDDDNNGNTVITGTWKFKEMLVDPGDGSGTFEPVESNKTITFNTNGTVTSNGNLCDMTTDTQAPSAGTYSDEESTISADCGYDLNYTLDNATLIVNYPCFEPCRAKFVRVQ